jgi:hypothetical protein
VVVVVVVCVLWWVRSGGTGAPGMARTRTPFRTMLLLSRTCPLTPSLTHPSAFAQPVACTASACTTSRAATPATAGT